MTLAVIALAAIAGLIAVLKIIAPKTKTTFDDTVLDVAENAEPFVEELADKDSSK